MPKNNKKEVHARKTVKDWMCSCGERNPFTSYVFAHWNDRLTTFCSKCNVQHDIWRGIATPRKERPVKVEKHHITFMDLDEWYNQGYQVDGPALDEYSLIIFAGRTADEAEMEKCKKFSKKLAAQLDLLTGTPSEQAEKLVEKFGATEFLNHIEKYVAEKHYNASIYNDD